MARLNSRAFFLLISSAIAGRFAPQIIGGIGAINVRLWHIADVPLGPTNVCFWGKTGRVADAPLFR